MLPAITPPTDSLYKFLTLFGLTIFLFYVIMLSDTYHDSTLIQIKIENLAYKIQEETGVNLTKTEGHRISLRPFQHLEDRLVQLNSRLEKAGISYKKRQQYLQQLNGYQIQIDAYQTKITFCWVLIFVGISLIVIGFRSWFSREQKLRNILLQLEIDEKRATIRKLNTVQSKEH